MTPSTASTATYFFEILDCSPSHNAEPPFLGSPEVAAIWSYKVGEKWAGGKNGSRQERVHDGNTQVAVASLYVGHRIKEVTLE